MVNILANILIGLIALLHVYFLILEIFLWDKPIDLKVFGHDLEFARKSKVLAMNQGLYNVFLALGLGWEWDQDIFPWLHSGSGRIWWINRPSEFTNDPGIARTGCSAFAGFVLIFVSRYRRVR